MAGKVYLIGMGPGDPELITVKAIKAVKKCQVLIYDRLVNEKLLDYNRSAEKIYVGKTTGQHTMSQEEINALLVQKAKEGYRVGRLKGGDPFVFGRGGEEALYLKDNGIEYEIVPGITSAVSVPMYANIPVTFRGMATSFHVITGHEHSEVSNIEWEALAKLKGTLVFLMGVENLELITGSLMAHGKRRDCPAAVIMNGTRENQREVFGTLETIVERSKKAEVKSPAIIIIGETVGLHEALDNKKSKPLSGVRVINTRPEDKMEELTDMLKEAGASVVELPCIRTYPIVGVQLKGENITSYDGIVFSSAYGVISFMEALRSNKIDVRCIKGKLFGVGPSIGEALEKNGLFDCIIPEIFNAAELAKCVTNMLPEGSKLLVVSGNLGGDALVGALSNYPVDRLEIYETVEGCEKAVDGSVHAILFTSPSCVRGFLKRNAISKFKDLFVVCIGQSTLEEAVKQGFENAAAAMGAKPEQMVEALADWRLKDA